MSGSRQGPGGFDDGPRAVVAPPGGSRAFASAVSTQRSWVDLVADVLTDPHPVLPVARAAVALAHDLRAAAAWRAVVRPGHDDAVTCLWTSGGAAHGAGARLGAQRVVRELADAPPDGVHFAGALRGPDDGAARATGSAGVGPYCRGAREPAAAVAVVALPVPGGDAGAVVEGTVGDGTAGRGMAGGVPEGVCWLVLARAWPYSVGERGFVRAVHGLLLGLARHVALADAAAPTAGSPTACPVRLTGREHAVLGLMAQGLIGGAIGRRLGVSPRTVAKHQEHIYRKLDASDRLGAVLRAQEVGLLVRPDGPPQGPRPHPSHRLT